jgi:hypothetical protein
LSPVSSTTLAEDDPDAWLEATLSRLDDWGLILDSDPKLPSWPSLVVDRRVRGSWWADPQAHLIHEVGGRLTGHADVLHVVLVSGKRTCVHRRLWPAFVAVVISEDRWKLEGLSRAAQALRKRLAGEPNLYADEPDMPSTSVRENGRAMRQLEERLLAAGGSMHTARGSHAKFVTRWDTWMAERNLSRPAMSAIEGQDELDECLVRLNREFDGHGTLPWWRS